MPVRVVSLSKLPFDQARFDEDFESLRGCPDEAEWREQLMDCWNIAWIVVVEWNGPPDAVDFDDIQHPTEPGQPKPNRQVPWDEQILHEDGHSTRAAFFLHLVNRSLPLYYQGEPLLLPKPTDPEPDVLEHMKYSAPT